MWEHDLAGPAAQVTVRGGAEGAKLLVSNLHASVTNEDIKELFGMVGALKSASVNFNAGGRSKGTAEVVFAQRADALAALKRYNGATLDGQPMAIEAVAPAAVALGGGRLLSSGMVVGGARGAGGAGGVPVRSVTVTVDNSRGRGGLRSVNPLQREGRVQVGAGRGGGRGRLGGGRGEGRGRGGRAPKEASKSAADLDAELEAYAASTMQE